MTAAFRGSPRLSLCVIARDEAENLAELLQQMQGIVDEIVVVDTGSSDDRTLEVAWRFGARTGHHTWIDSFAAARNAALDLATGDWVLSLDADERLREATPGALRAMIRNAPPGASRPQYVCFCPVFRHQADTAHPESASSFVAFASRLFPRHPDIRWAQPLYEMPVLVGDPGNLSSSATAEIQIIHLGHPNDPERRAAKAARNKRIVEAALARTPDQAFPYFAAGHEAFLAVDYATAAQHLQKAVELAGERPASFIAQAYVDLISALREGNNLDEAIRYGQQALRYFPRADVDCAVGLAYQLRKAPGDDEQALRAYQRARLLHNVGTAKLGDQDAMTWKPLWGMGHIYQQRGLWDRALTAYQDALRYLPHNPTLQRNVATALRKLGRSGEAVSHLRQVVTALEVTASQTAGPGSTLRPPTDLVEANVALADALGESGQVQESYDHLQALANRYPAEPTFLLRTADVLITAKEYATAVANLGGALDQEFASEPRTGAALYARLGEALTHLGKHEDAANAFAVALDLDPGNEAAKLGQRAVAASLRPSP